MTGRSGNGTGRSGNGKSRWCHTLRCKRDSYKPTHTVQSMVQHHDLHPTSPAHPHQHVAGVGVAVDEAMLEDHLTVHLAQLQGDLGGQEGTQT